MTDLFLQPGTAYTLFWLSLASVLGIYLGKVSFFGVKIGIAGVLFSGLALGAFGVHVDPHVLHFIKEFGLVLFVFTIGIQVGPGFFRSLRSDGLTLNLLAAGLVLSGVAIATVHHFVFEIPVEAMVGILSGAVTNTPGLGAAQQALTENIGSAASKTAGAAYAVAYPFGIMGIIFSMILIRLIFRVDINQEKQEAEKKQSSANSQLTVRNLCIRNPRFFNKTIGLLIDACKEKVVISRFKRAGEEVQTALPDMTLQEGDCLLGVGSERALDHLVLLAGDECTDDLRQLEGRMVTRKVLITKSRITNKTLGDINLTGRYRANLTRIIRSGVQFTPVGNINLHLGDIVTVVAPEDEIDLVVGELGNTPQDLHHPNMLLLFIGISLGLVLGSLAIPVPGLPTPVKLGMAGGPLVVALIFGRLGKVGNLNLYLHPGANLVLREMGILLFLGCVGLGSGKSFIPALTGENGLTWVLLGASITFFPVFLTGLVARIKKVNYLSIAGLLAGGMTDPPALGYANSLIEGQSQSVAYASVYPLTMLLRIMSAQLFVILLL